MPALGDLFGGTEVHDGADAESVDDIQVAVAEPVEAVSAKEPSPLGGLTIAKDVATEIAEVEHRLQGNNAIGVLHDGQCVDVRFGDAGGDSHKLRR